MKENKDLASILSRSGQNQKNNDLNVEPSELIGKHFGKSEKTEEHKNIRTKEQKNKRTENKKKNNDEELDSSVMSRDKENVSHKEALENLAKRLEGELNKTSFIQPVDITDEKKGEKNEDILELEKEIEDLEESLLPRQDLEPAHELEGPEDIELPKSEDKEEIKKLKEEKKKEEKERKRKEVEERERIKKEKEQEEREREEKKNKEREEKERIKRKEQERKRKEKEGQKRKQEEEKLKRQEEKRIKKEEQERCELEKKEEKKRLKEEKARLKEERKRQKELEKQMQPKLGFGWYVNQVKRPVVYLAGVEFLIYFFSSLNSIKSFLLNIILPLLLILDVIIFGWLAAKVMRRHERDFWTALKTCLLAGALVGLARAIFKLVWLNEVWTMFNVLVEPIITAGYALVTAAIVRIFMMVFSKKKQIQTNPINPKSQAPNNKQIQNSNDQNII